MIEKMEFLSIIGPRDQLDRVTEKYLGKYEIQLENTVGELKNLKNIVPSSESNPYREWIGRAQEAAAIVEGRSGAGASEKKAASAGRAGTKGLLPEERLRRTFLPKRRWRPSDGRTSSWKKPKERRRGCRRS